MKLYLITFDGQPYYVEAESMPAAQAVWLEAMREEWGEDWDGTEEPEQIALIHDEPAIRTLESMVGGRRNSPPYSREQLEEEIGAAERMLNETGVMAVLKRATPPAPAGEE